MEAITEGQKKQYLRLVEDAAERALKETGLDKDGLQKLIENSDEFLSRIVTAIRELSVSNQYANEETEPSGAYLPGYKPKSITQQINILRQLFPGLGDANEKLAEAELNQNAEGWFAIPRWEKIAPTYGEAVQKVLNLIKQTRNGAFCNYREGQLGPQHLRQSQNSAKAWEKLGREQKDYDILIVPAQFGIRHCGCSIRRARSVMRINEFGLGAFAVAIMILTHPERLMNQDDLWIDCPGDELAPVADGNYSESPGFKWRDGEVKFGARKNDLASTLYGSASGLL